MKNVMIAVAALCLSASAAAAQAESASTPANPALDITLPEPDTANNATARATSTRTAAVGANVADPSRSLQQVWPQTTTTAAPARESAHTGKPDVSTSCLPGELKSVLNQIERRWGDVLVVSAHRPGATIRGSGRPSKHATCQAVDFKPAPGTYRAVARWLKETHNGGVGTYSGHLNHIHIDVGPKLSWHN